MRGFFEARSVVVVGVSERPGNLGQGIVNNLRLFGFPGVIHLVGARAGSFQGMPILASVGELPEAPDLAVVLVPALHIPGVFEALGERGVRRVVVESGGFEEHGEDGRLLGLAVKAAAARHGIRFIGPNGLGVASFAQGLVTLFATMLPIFRPGGIAVLGQSGGVGVQMLLRLVEAGFGISRYVSLGNKLDVDENDLLEFLLQDDATQAVVLYLEGLADGRRFLDLLRSARKPVLVHKANVGALSRNIASTHTASLGGDDDVLDAALRQAGAWRFREVDTLVDDLRVALKPPLRGDRIAVISRSGGHAVICCDACEHHGLRLAPLPEDLPLLLKSHLRSGVVRLVNPLDLGDIFHFPIYGEAVRRALASDQVDGALFLHTYSTVNEKEASRSILRSMPVMEEASGKPVAVVVVTEAGELADLREFVPGGFFDDPWRAVGALAGLRAVGRREDIEDPAVAFPAESRIRAILEECLREGRQPSLPEVLEALSAAGLPMQPWRLTRSVEEALQAASDLGMPVAMKIVSDLHSHKTDVGGVLLGLGDLAAVEAGWHGLSRLGDQVLVQSMATDGLDMLVGGLRDPNFGPVVLVGLGGIWVEVLRDVARRVGPVGPCAARNMLGELRGAALLRGARGMGPRDEAALVDAIQRVSLLMEAFPQILSLDVNPLRVGSVGACVIDARIVVNENTV